MQVRQLPGSTQTRQTIVDTVHGYLKGLTDDLEGDSRLALDVGTAYMRVARVQGVPISANLGQAGNAEATLLLAEGAIASVLAAEPASRTARLRAAQIAHDRMILAGNGRAEGTALPLARQSAQWLDSYLTGGAVPAAELDQALITLNNVGNRFRIERNHTEALRLTQRGIDLARAGEGPTARLQAGALLIGMDPP